MFVKIKTMLQIRNSKHSSSRAQARSCTKARVSANKACHGCLMAGGLSIVLPISCNHPCSHQRASQPYTRAVEPDHHEINQVRRSGMHHGYKKGTSP
jgi:molybdenum cofactor biosynthesis enzyme MoaA